MINEQEAERWINGLTVFDRDNTIILFCMFSAFGIPQSYLDVGSGTGVMVNTAEKLGVPLVAGIDILPRPNHPKLIQADLRYPIDLGASFDLVSSIETAEHITPEAADTFMDNICRHTTKRIVFTAAMPGQQGDGHVNLQQMTYWRSKFWDRGFDWNAPETWRLALMLSNAHHASHHVEANLSVFTKRP